MLSSFAELTVIELAHIYNGPYCGLMFAHLGAEVIKVEPPSGEKLRGRARADADPQEFIMLNSNKKSVALDLKSADGREALLRLADSADVLIENYAPGALERLGLGPETLLARNPRLIVASGKGYGSSGPYAALPAMDLTVQAMSGAIATSGFQDGAPVKAGPAFTDFSGGIHLFGAAMAALYDRELTGRGRCVEVSMHDTIYPMLTSALSGLYNYPDRELPQRTGNRHSGLAMAPYNVYRAADGWLAIISAAEAHWQGVCRALGIEGLLDDPRFATVHDRADHMDALDTALTEATSALTREELTARLGAHKVPCAPVKELREVDADPHLIERGMIRYVDHPKNGRVPTVGNPLRMSAGCGEEPLTPAPAVGADQVEVLGRLAGLSAAEAQRLRGQ
ncbi:CaiB/BaiF CoA transferase family protein [Brevibacterium album]|uniref:CaiB/BaiF CoA transferase family protein n=1 Tax=Brevibacterium album TaxID=417948 RepID=UPI00042521A1|nr:CoA transferase [Brevibacterium album]